MRSARTGRGAPDIGYVALLAGLVLLPLYPKIGLLSFAGTYIPLRLDDLITGGVVGAWAAQLVREGIWPRTPRLAIPAIAWLAVGLAALAVGGFVARTVSPGTGLLYWAKPIEYLLLGWVAYDRVRDDRRLRQLIGVVIVTALVVVAYGILQWLHWAPTPPTYVPGATLGIVTSTFADAHQLATYIGIAAALSIAWVGIGTRGISAAALAVIAGGAWVLVQTGTRSEFLAALALAAVLTAAPLPWTAQSRSRGRQLRRLSSVAFALCLLGSAAIPGILEARAPSSIPATEQTSVPAVDVTDRLGSDLSQDVSLSVRLQDKWPRLLRLGLANPMLGAGPSAAGEAADGYLVRSFAETGILGTAAFALLIAFLLAALWAACRTAPDAAASVAGAAIVATVFVSVVGLLIDTWVASRPMQLYWPVVGAVLGAAAAARTEPEPLSAAIARP